MTDELQNDHQFQKLKDTVHRLGREMQVMMIEQAKADGRIKSAEESIDRLRLTSATSAQVLSLSELVTLKLDHLREGQFATHRQITWSTRLVFALFIGGVIALAWVAK
jgi:hypothetical protein